MLEHLHTVDFETEAIVGNPLINPPRPVGVAITYPNYDTVYLTGEDMVLECRKIWQSGVPVLFHNAPFDLSVADKWIKGCPFPEATDWERIHDTTYLVFLKDPHAPSLSLKPSAERYLDLPPEEQEDLKAWILANVPEATAKNFGAHISKAPVELVAPYAKGDTIRTRGLFDLLWGAVPREPYDRERRLMPHMVAGTKRGVRCNRPALQATLDASMQAQERCEQLIRAKLGAPTLNPHSSRELAAALDAADAVTGWELTPTGKNSTAKDNLMKHIRDPELLNLLTYTGTMQTVIGTFIEPWLNKSAADGRLHPNWNQTRQPNERGTGSKGTRTGRLSSDDPNFQNPPNPFTFDLPEGLIAIPSMREFILPEEGHVWLKRDWSGQEMRILAHFEEGSLMEAYQQNPDLDPHGMVRQIVLDMTGKDFQRRFIKETGFGMIYGMGAPGLAKKIGGGMTNAEGKELQDAYKLALPGVGEIQAATKQRGRSGQAVTTWGGREYYAEEPRIMKGKYRSFEYKLTNYLIQGSAGDQCKEVMCDWHETKSSDAIFMATIHDELNISAPADDWRPHMDHLRDCMEKDYFDVPMRSDCFMGPNWGAIEKQEEVR